MKTDEAIKTDVFKAIRGSELAQAITGKVSKRKRPHNSKNEDVLISVLANNNRQVQVATVNVNIYVADITVDNQPEEDTVRIETLSQLALNLFNVLWGPEKDYRISLIEQRVYEVSGANEHIINNKLEYKHLNE